MTCTGVNCPSSEPLGGSPAKSKRPCPAGGRYSRQTKDDPTCTASCAAGYYHRSSDNGYSCSPDGTWVADDRPINCIPKTCKGNPTGEAGTDGFDPNVYDLDSGEGSCTTGAGNYEGDGCDATCMPGYKQKEGTKKRYKCVHAGGQNSPEGKWSGGNIECIGIPCKSDAPRGNDGSAVANAAKCERAAHYNRQKPLACNFVAGKDSPCLPGYNQWTGDSGRAPGTWTECESRRPPQHH